MPLFLWSRKKPPSSALRGDANLKKIMVKEGDVVSMGGPMIMLQHLLVKKLDLLQYSQDQAAVETDKKQSLNKLITRPAKPVQSSAPKPTTGTSSDTQTYQW
jgi:pyruvate/2-oxoglutarate dehydrogenase complex dihydrolipoamide acyltransferase (E2) component